MARVTRGFKARRRRNKILKRAKGFHFDRRTKFRHAAQTVERAQYNEYKGRRLLKREMRKLWIIRINAAARINGMSYSVFMSALTKKGVEINRKMLAEIAFTDADAFKAIVESVK
jgi:large subunit ribosomal protein L20